LLRHARAVWRNLSDTSHDADAKDNTKTEDCKPVVILRNLSYLILSSTPCESQQGTIISDAFELEQEIQVIHVQIGPRLFADGV